jgi:MinD-like ATPase involved in chromosome partitioning or flagellar assembly
LLADSIRLDSSALADPYAQDTMSWVDDDEIEPGGFDRSGCIVAVWGPLGSPGRTTIALGLAAELARIGQRVLLVDADTFGASVAIRLGLLDEAPGLAAAARAANAGSLDDASFARVVRRVRAGLEVLTGVSRPSRWRELRPSGLEHVWDAARRRADITIVDIGFCIESDDALGIEPGAPTRAAAALSALANADDVIAVGVPDPVSVARLVPGIAALRELAPSASLHVIANRVPKRSSEVSDFTAVLARHANVEVAHIVIEDAATLRDMTAQGLLPTEIRGRSSFASDMRPLARLFVSGQTVLRSDDQETSRPSRAGSRRLARIAS